MSTKSIGNEAEGMACLYLQEIGYKILDRNWTTRWCEIDVVCTKGRTVYFVEVKYRKNNLYGDGLDAITSIKLKQMNFAAEVWVNSNKWEGDYELAVISVNPKTTEFLII